MTGVTQEIANRREEEKKSSVNDIQVGGDHYRSDYQHWDFVEGNGVGYLEGCATKYLTRWRSKNGVQDLEKSKHYVDKLIELATSSSQTRRRNRGTVNEVRLKSFMSANKIPQLESIIIELIVNWNAVPDVPDLVRASRLIEALISVAQTEERLKKAESWQPAQGGIVTAWPPFPLVGGGMPSHVARDPLDSQATGKIS